MCLSVFLKLNFCLVFIEAVFSPKLNFTTVLYCTSLGLIIRLRLFTLSQSRTQTPWELQPKCPLVCCL